jgi:undecaprenyl-diphosphatase
MVAIARIRPRVVIGALSAAVLLTGFGLLADEVTEGDTLNFDTNLLMSLRMPGDPATPIGPIWFQEAARDITALGSFSVLGIVVIAVVIDLILRRKIQTAAFVAVAVLGGTIVSSALKAIFDRPRPDLAATARVFTASFPSGHATLSAVVYLTLGVLLAEAAKERSRAIYYCVLAIFLTIIVGLSRVYLGVHYPTDVIAGWSLGTAWALLCWVGAKLMIPTHEKGEGLTPNA